MKHGKLHTSESAQTSAYQVGDYVTFGAYPQTPSGMDDASIE